MRRLALLGGLAALFAVQTVSTAAVAQDTGPAEEGTLIQIGPDRASDRRERRQQRRQIRRPGFAEAAPAIAASKYWIGLGGGPLPPELRAQVDLPTDEGVLVRTVADDGPAAEAGLKPYDIVRRANNQPVSTLAQLADVVAEQGELKGRITLDLLRGGKPKTIWVAPVERPADAAITIPRGERLGLLGRDGQLLEGLLGGEGFQLEGLEEQLGGLGEMMPQMALGGVSVNVARNGDGPAKVTVRRGEDTWEFDEGDEAAMNALPEDVRPMVDQLLQGGGVGPGFGAFGFDAGGLQFRLGGDGFGDRFLEMQKRMQALRQQFGDAAPGEAAAPLIEPEIELGEAPAFNGGAATSTEDAGPIEIEIPDEEPTIELTE